MYSSRKLYRKLTINDIMKGQNIQMNMLKENNLQKPMVVALLALVCCFLWGSAFPCIKIGYRMFDIAASDTAGQIFFVP